MPTLYNKSCYGLEDVPDNSVDCILTDPPYGIDLADWDKLPDKKIWKDCFRVLKPGGYLASFSSIRFQHVFTKDILEAGFVFNDVLLWVFLNGRVPPIAADKAIDKHLGVEREVVGTYKYVQGAPSESKKDTYTHEKEKSKTKATSDEAKKWEGFGTGLKTFYEPIIIVQKPLEGKLAENILKWGTGAMNLEGTRIPYDEGEDKVGHNPHPMGRCMGNIIQTEDFGDYQRFFFVGKVRDSKKTGNHHPTVKPEGIMAVLTELLSRPGQTILDPFMGSGTTGVVAGAEGREFIGYELSDDYFKIAVKRINK